MVIKCVFAATNASGSPDFGFVKVECTDSQYELGEHYDTVKEWAKHNDYEAPIIVFDEQEAPNWLLERFVWDSASVIKVLSDIPWEPGDQVLWTDPDEGKCSRHITIQSIESHGDVVKITGTDGSYLECFASELS